MSARRRGQRFACDEFAGMSSACVSIVSSGKTAVRAAFRPCARGMTAPTVNIICTTVEVGFLLLSADIAMRVRSVTSL